MRICGCWRRRGEGGPLHPGPLTRPLPGGERGKPLGIVVILSGFFVWRGEAGGLGRALTQPLPCGERGGAERLT